MMDPREVRVDILAKIVRHEYKRLHDQGVTHARMAEATGLPESTFSMLLTGYRKITKVRVLDALIKGLPRLEDGV